MTNNLTKTRKGRHGRCSSSSSSSSDQYHTYPQPHAVPEVGMVKAAVGARTKGTRPLSALRHLKKRLLLLKSLAQRREVHLLLCYFLAQLDEKKCKNATYLERM